MDAKSGNELLMLNVVPNGVPAWISYTQYRRLKALLEAAMPMSANAGHDPAAIAQLWQFINATARLTLPDDAPDDLVWFNGYTLRARGYKVEELTRAEYGALAALYEQAEPTEPDDMDLHDEGTHRQLYDMLTCTLSLDVEAGRGPVWRRAMRLLNVNGPKYEGNHGAD